MFFNRISWDRTEVELVSADIPMLLTACAAKGICLLQVSQTDRLTVILTVERRDIRRLGDLAKKSGSSMKIRKNYGIFPNIRKLKGRPVLLCVCFLLLVASLWIPENVLFFRVEGNERVPAKKILEAADGCGIGFGASRRSVRSEQMKNNLLAKLPELQWAGINTKGCTAVITVREREEDHGQSSTGGVVSLVAARDGIVQSGTSTAGSLLCRPGQAVKAGDVLISGYTDCGISIRAQRAKGEIMALTVRPISVMSPVNYIPKGETERQIKKYSITIGKKQIFLSKDSGISYTTCDKICREYALTLPGDFVLPVTFSVETFFLRSAGEATVDGEMAQALCTDTAREYIQGSMIAGKILDSDLHEALTGTVYHLTGNFLCSEMIARERSEEIMQSYGKNSGEDR